MYKVTLKNGNKNTEIHGLTQKLSSGSVVQGINGIDSFTFSLLVANIGYDKIQDFKTLVSVYNTTKKRYDFLGRVLYSENSMDTNGLIEKQVICESYLGFLCDSIQTYIEPKNWTLLELFSQIINVHNSQVEEYKQFKIGIVTVEDPNDNIYIGIQRNNSWKTIEDKLIKKLGGEISFRVEDDGIYLDYLKEIGGTRSTTIELSKNMKSITREDDPTNYVTYLIPLGAKLQDENGNDTEERVTIETVNNGINYIKDVDAEQKFGKRYGIVEFDDVHEPSILLSKGNEWLKENNKVKVKYTLTALDLSPLGIDIDDIEVGYKYPLKNPLMNINDTARIIKKTINVLDETKSTIELGEKFKTLSDLNLENKDKVEGMGESVDDALHIGKENEGKIENIKEDINNVRATVTQNYTDLLKNTESLILEALKSYTETSDFNTYKETIEAQLKLMADNMTLKFTETYKTITEINGVLHTQLNTISKYFTFDINGLTIGQADNPNKVIIDNDEISILVNGVVVQKFDSSGKALMPDVSITRSLDLLGFLINKDENGNVNCSMIGD